MKKDLQKFKLCLLVGLLALSLSGYSQTTCDFSSVATLSGITGTWPWNTQADIIIGGVAYQMTSVGNGSFTNAATGGVSNSKCLRKDGSGGDFFKLQRTDGKPFQFYGIWVNHQSMNQYSTMVQVPPWYTLTASTFTFQDNTAMTAGTAYNNYTSSTQTISAGTNGITTGSVEINFPAILYYSIDNIIVGPAPLTSTTSQTNLTCNGDVNGTARVSVSGGTTPYTYAWLPFGGTGESASGLVAGNYTCTITDGSNSTLSKSFTITQPNAITVTKNQTNVSCNGGFNGSATVSVTGGTSPYSYSWSPYGGIYATASGLTAGNFTCTITDYKNCITTSSFTITQPTLLSLTPASQTNISCNGGSNGAATVNAASGGTGAYTYDWTPGTPTGDGTVSVTGLVAGTWTCTATDVNGCTISKSFIITQPTALNLTPSSQTNISCNGGSTGAATVNAATGGTGTYTYNWSPGTPTGDGTVSVTGLVAGTWICTATDANGCATSKSFTITQPTALTLNPSSQTNISCNGGSNGAASVNAASGGTGAYTYDWTPGTPTGDGTVSVTGLVAGTWICTATDANGCATSKSFTITQPTALTLNPSSQTNISCNGGSNGAASVNTASGGTGTYTYKWSPGFPTGDGTTSVTGLFAGTWICTVTDANGCSNSKAFTITQPTELTLNPSSQTNISCNGGSNGAATVNAATGGSGAYTYDWTPGTPTGDGTVSVTGLVAGTWTCTATDVNGCTISKSFTITQPTALTLTPSSQTNISCNGGSNGAATVNAATGGTGTYTYNWSPGTPTGDGTVSVNGLVAGTWICTATDAYGCSKSYSFNVTQPTALIATTSKTDIYCGGSYGTATVSVSGGTSPYVYSWSPNGGTGATATGITAGTYTCTITDYNSCQITKNFTISQTDELKITDLIKHAPTYHGASDGSATVSVSGGSSPYNYKWLPQGGTDATAIGLSKGEYTITVLDANGCVKLLTFIIYEPAAITVLTNASSNITSTDATLNGLVNGDGVSTNVTFEYGTSITYGKSVSAVQSPLNSSVPTAVSHTLTDLTSNTMYHYRVVAVNAGGTAYGENSTFKTSTITELLNSTDKEGIKVYPNPVTNKLYIEMESTQLPVVKLYNLQGMMLLIKKDKTVDMSVYAPGAYVIEINGTRLIVLKK